MMARLLTSLFLFLGLASFAFAGTPVFSGDQNGMSAMECCKKHHADNIKNVSAAQLCCALNCNTQAPNSSSSVFNFSPSVVNVTDSVLSQIAFLLKKENSTVIASVSFERIAATPSFQPKYIQHHSFLI